MAWVGLVVGQLHALARFETADGREDLELPLVAAWAEPAADAVRPLLDWGSPDLVYVTYGKVWFPVFLAFTLCAVVVRRRRDPVGVERWAWRVALTGYVIACLAVLLTYWTQWTGRLDGLGLEATLFEASWLVTLPGLLLTMLGSTLLGVALLVRRFRPLPVALVLALTIPLAIAVLQATSMGSAALPVAFAFGVLGRRIARGDAPARAVASTAAAQPVPTT
jgi:hypothetical protein